MCLPVLQALSMNPWKVYDVPAVRLVTLTVSEVCAALQVFCL